MGQTEKVAAAKKAQVQADLASATTYDASVHIDFLKATSRDITVRIQRGEWTASRVLEAYIARAAYAQRQTNCLTEIMFVRARKVAEELDEEFANTKKLKGPLHGVPISLKDLVDFVGVDSSLGFSQWVGNKPTVDAEIAKQLMAAGGIPFVKTNVPQTLFAFESCNPIFGRTLNPYNPLYTCGGSSGGEGALLGMDGSVIGLGTDIGGSLRIPALYNGIYSLKPGSGRVSMRGCRDPTPGFEGIIATAGPMARSVDDLEVAAKLMFGKGGVAPVPFREVELPAKLKFGYYTSDDYIKASPACKRAVLETVEALRKQGHECIEVILPAGLAAEAFNVFIGLTSADGYKALTAHLGPDPKEEALFLPTLAAKIPRPLRALVHWIIRDIVGDQLFAGSVAAARPKSMYEYMQLVERREAVKECFKTEVWDKHGLDGIIAPIQALPQLPHGGCKTLSGLAASTIFYNILDIPAGALPITHVDPSLDILTEEWKSGPGLGSKMLEKELYHKKNPVYDAEKMKGMPVGIQLAALRWEDEKVLSMMRVVDDALGPRQFGPGVFAAAHPGEK